MTPKWDLRFLALCEHVGHWSKDPSSQVGAVIAKGNRIISLGFNGFPARIDDDITFYEDRKVKLSRVIHAESNAILYACGAQEGGTLYTYPFPPCSDCAKFIIQAGIDRCVSIQPELAFRRRYNYPLTKQLLHTAGVILSLFTEEDYAEREGH